MALTIKDIEAARKRIAPYIVETPLLRLRALDRYLGCQVYVKAECMQTTGSFKLRGAMNKLLSLTPDELERGVVAASSGNHGKALAYAAKILGIKAAIILPYTVTKVKEDTIQSLGAEILKCEVSERFEFAERVSRERGAVLVPPFNDEAVMSGQGTAGLEITDQSPDIDAVIVPVSGGGLISGVSTAVKARCPHIRIFGAEPARLPRYTASLKAGHPVQIEKKATIADALISQVPGDLCFPYVAENTDLIADVEEEFILKGMKLLLLEGKLLCEPSSAIGLGAVLEGLIPVNPADKICFLISGGSVSFEQLKMLEGISF